jgi:predicted amidohydrolase
MRHHSKTDNQAYLVTWTLSKPVALRGPFTGLARAAVIAPAFMPGSTALIIPGCQARLRVFSLHCLDAQARLRSGRAATITFRLG